MKESLATDRQTSKTLGPDSEELHKSTFLTKVKMTKEVHHNDPQMLSDVNNDKLNQDCKENHHLNMQTSRNTDTLHIVHYKNGGTYEKKVFSERKTTGKEKQDNGSYTDRRFNAEDSLDICDDNFEFVSRRHRPATSPENLSKCPSTRRENPYAF